MKKLWIIIIIAVILFLALGGYYWRWQSRTSTPILIKSSAPALPLWAKSFGGGADDEGIDAATDAAGNVVVVGHFASPTISFETTTLTNTDSQGESSDIFIVKYGASGHVLWAKAAGGASEDYGLRVAMDASGNVLVTGVYLSQTIAFGTAVLTNASSTCTQEWSTNGCPDMFVVKLDADGNWLWAKSAGGAYDDEAWGIATDSAGNVLVTGGFASPTIAFGTTVLTNADSTGTPTDYFLVKYDSMGNVLWAQRAGGGLYDHGLAVTADASGNVLVTGWFDSPTITFGSTVLTNGTDPSWPYDEIFTVKYDPGGNVLWARSAVGIYEDDGTSIATDASGNVLVTGYFTSPSLTFGAITLVNAGGNCSTSGCGNSFIAKYDANGNVLWAKAAGGTNGDDHGHAVSIDASGNALVIGDFASPTMAFGATVLNNSDSTGKTGDIFFVKYDVNGNVLWAKAAGGSGNDVGNGIALSTTDNSVVVTGGFSSPSITLGAATLTNAGPSGTSDVFVARIK